MKGTKVTKIAGMFLLAGLCMTGALPQQAKADQADQKTIFTFSGPVEIPGKVLDKGTYVFKVLDVQGDRDVVQVSNKAGNKVYGTFLTIPDYRMKPTGKVIISFDERTAGSPEAIKGWFYPGDSYGHHFVYPKARAVLLAKANNTPVPSMPDDLAANTTKPASSIQDESVAQMRQAPLKVQTPREEEVEVAEVFEVPPAPAAAASTLPKTASLLPLIGLLGLLSLSMGMTLRLVTAKSK